MGTGVEMYPVIQIQFLDGLWNRPLGTRRSAIGHFFPISPVTVPEAFAKPVHSALFRPFSFFKGTNALISHVRAPSEWDWLMEMLDLLYLLFDD